MRKYSTDHYHLTSPLSEAQIIARLAEQTHKKKYLFMSATDKAFTGRIGDTNFEIFENSFFLMDPPVFYKEKLPHLELTTTLHKAFRIIWIVWIVVVTIGFLVSWLFGPREWTVVVAFVIGMPIATTLFRLFLHARYVYARNRGIQKISAVLDANISDIR